MKKLKVVISGQKHISTHNLPRNSRHTLIYPQPFPRGKYPIAKLWHPLGSFIPWRPIWSGYEVIHSFNRIISTNKPWFVTFEDHRSLYRNPKNQLESIVYNILNNRLGLDNCQKIIAMSEFAKYRIIKRIEGWDVSEKIKQKLTVIHPNFPVRANHPKTYDQKQELQFIFVGGHIARKGGIVALRFAKKAEQLGLPIKVHIISGLVMGKGVPTDFPNRDKYAEDLKLLDLNNVIYHKSLPNKQVLELLSQSHFQLLATLQDTYGFSIAEGFSVATPAISTNICALPELIRPGENGYLLDLPLNESRQWKNWVNTEKLPTDEYWQILNSTYDDLAAAALQEIIKFLDRDDKQEHYESLSTGALAQAQNVNNAEKQNQLFDDLYAAAAGVY
ncbi:glycosyltransferase family 4 protein [Anabaena cylindrica FACHB-243]|uniref:Glycosyl transferase group 1 n=1 Tax=Anabaena cylindrica (strain ATCC 27899 / PCC 7122) TaxID=272123 RepID=K9ZLN8_ANACC|nr:MULTISPECIES: glycosyltransferase family 4 protein [Anabaena]AFZ59225.1 glycosyl transferase group 1 [Anabaena cylindrica PCC 7122]MBD2416575.1 glycosyltransferase family 4 protein [Anabaena cylindrica FACHB-243]MBY5280926.1 glycosyltransferase family 4 protein [Anabaena sp. CCAP 1446/1C]MBY5310557.1 glycosyltransferase family 4 protein [Anabaena sp. CCAP 1446/1C]MCM2407515.1 glycosyltransferase family 4 protein [Anabaena sp. CCAP 1446/1C]